MGVIKPKGDYYKVDPEFKPGPRNGHYSEPHAQYEAVFGPVSRAMAPLFNDVPIEVLKQSFRDAPPTIPDGCPEVGRDVAVEHVAAPVRDGTKIDLKVYRGVRGSGGAAQQQQNNATCVLMMHGGGWTCGGHETEEALNRYLAVLPNVVVVSVDYRMAPEFPFPYALNDSYDILLWCKRNPGRLNINSEKIVVAGGSAGANLAAAVAIRARDDGVTGIIGQCLSIPVTCHPKFFANVPNKERYELLSYVQNHDAYIIDALAMEFFWDSYVGRDPQHGDVGHSPLLATNLRGLPPAILLVAGLDTLRDEGIAYAEALKAAGVPTELHVYKGLPHGWTLSPQLEESIDYYKRACDFVKWCSESRSNTRRSHL